MRRISKIFLVDDDMRRRATISHCLSQCGIHVEPYENVAELRGHMAEFGLVLIHDDGAEIARAVDCLAETGNWMPVIGFAEAPEPRAVARAIHLGAIDYLAWPFAQDEVMSLIADAAVTVDAIGDRQNRVYTAK